MKVEKATYLTKAAQIPQTTVGDVQLYYRGKQYHEAGEPRYPEGMHQLVYNHEGHHHYDLTAE